MSTLKVYDDLAKDRREFSPQHPPRISMYVCGVTVYAPCHIGHARAYSAFDTIRRYLQYKGFDVYHIQNFTDVDDKIIKRAAEAGVTISEITERFIAEYYHDMDSLNILRATAYPRATEYISDMIEFAQTLIEKGFAYETDGNVFYDISKFDGYGKLSGRGISEIPVQEPAPGKRNPSDFALWKSTPDTESGWQSPWGHGRPGWHLECSVMARKLAGDTLDIHGGGCDLIFPHHENEIAQSEALTGKPFSLYWLHNGFIQIDKEKMSKSLGNTVNLQDILRTHRPQALRYFFLGAHYRMPLNFTPDRIAESESALSRIVDFIKRIHALKSQKSTKSEELDELAQNNLAETSIAEFIHSFEDAMDDDFNTPAALAAIFTLINKTKFDIATLENLNGPLPQAKVECLSKIAGQIFDKIGILGIDIEKLLAETPSKSDASADTDALMQIFIDLRKQARADKNWALADSIRDRLGEAGFALEDRPEGTTWKKIS